MHVYVCVCEDSAQFLVILFVAPFLCTCIYICIFMCIPDHICVQVHMHVYVYVKDPHWLFYMWPFLCTCMYAFLCIYQCIYVCGYACMSMCVCKGWRTISGGIPLSAIHLFLDRISEWPVIHQLGQNSRMVGLRDPPVSASSVMGLHGTCHSQTCLHGF